MGGYGQVMAYVAEGHCIDQLRECGRRGGEVMALPRRSVRAAALPELGAETAHRNATSRSSTIALPPIPDVVVPENDASEDEPTNVGFSLAGVSSDSDRCNWRQRLSPIVLARHRVTAGAISFHQCGDRTYDRDSNDDPQPIVTPNALRFSVFTLEAEFWRSAFQVPGPPARLEQPSTIGSISKSHQSLDLEAVIVACHVDMHSDYRPENKHVGK